MLAVLRGLRVFHVDDMWTSTRGGVRLMWTHVNRGEGGQKPDFLVDVINGLPPICKFLHMLKLRKFSEIRRTRHAGACGLVIQRLTCWKLGLFGCWGCSAQLHPVEANIRLIMLVLHIHFYLH